MNWGKGLLLVVVWFFVVAAEVGSEPLSWHDLLERVWDRSPRGNQAKATQEVALLSFELANLAWLPALAIESPSALSWTRSGGASVPILGSEPLSDNQDTLGVAWGLGIRQKLPAEGSFQAQIAQRVERNLTTEAYRQSPSVLLRVAQPLGTGSFDLARDPGWLLSRSDWTRSLLVYRKERREVVRAFLELVRQWHLSQDTLHYRQAVAEAASLRKSLNDVLFEKKTLSESIKWKSDRVSLSAGNDVEKAVLEVQDRLLEVKLLLGAEPPPVTTKDLEALLVWVASDQTSSTNTDIALLQEDRTGILRNAEKEELSHAPSVSFEFSLQPDSSNHPYYPSWDSSWEHFRHSPSRWTSTATLGISIPLEYSREPAVRRQATSTRLAAKRGEIGDVVKRQEGQSLLLRTKIDQFTAYRQDCDRQISEGQQLLVDTRALVAKGVLTEADAWDSESELAKIRQDRDEVLWDIILAYFDLRALLGQDLPPM